MTYVMSDLHGMYYKYVRMLEKIGFSDSDELFVLGDVVDRGPEPVKILRDMSLRPNVFPLMGNHEYMALSILPRLNTEITEENLNTRIDAALMEGLMLWQGEGGDRTLRDFRSLTPDDREFYIEYMKDFSLWEELEITGSRFVLVHAGIAGYVPGKPLDDYSYEQLLFRRPDYSQRYIEDAFLVTGHTPTSLIDEEYGGRIYMKNGHIAVDCGAVFGGPLGCIRLDDLKEFYVN